MARTPKPQIDQIKIKETTYDINVPKSWAQNDPAHVQYIKDRTHYQELLAGKDIPTAEIEAAKYSFKNVYAGTNRIFTDHWTPRQSWIYAGWPCTHETAKDHFEDSTCSGGFYEINFMIEVTDGSSIQTVSITPDKVDDKDTSNLVWINPYRNNGQSNEIQELAAFTSLQTESNLQIQAWKDCKLYYNTAGFFYIDGEPTEQDTSGTYSSRKSTLQIKPITERASTEGYRRYMYTKRLDAGYLPIDGVTVRLDTNGNLSAETIYWSDFQVTEQFGRYEPLETVPAAGRSVQDVLNDAFCTDKLPSLQNPSVTLHTKTSCDGYSNSSSHYEVGTTVNLDWAIRLNRGFYTYGLVDAGKKPIANTDGSKAYSNYLATGFSINTQVTPNLGENGPVFVDGFPWTLDLTAKSETADSCLLPNDIGADYRTLLTNDPITTIKLPATPIKQFKMNLAVVGKLDPRYTSSTMLGDISKPTVEFTTGFEGKQATDTTEAVSASPLTFTTANILTSDYRWFWTYSSEEAKVDVESEAIRQNYNSQLSGFPSKITTNKMRSMCFFLPKARAKYDAAGNLETSVEVLNDTTGAWACHEMLCKEVKVKDIGKNEHDYLMYYFTNKDPDSGTNIYEIVINDLNEEGGNS